MNALPGYRYCITCVPGAYGGRKRVSDTLELDLWVVVSHI